MLPDSHRQVAAPHNNALKLTKRAGPWVGALRAPSSLSRASQLSAVLGRLTEIVGAIVPTAATADIYSGGLARLASSPWPRRRVTAPASKGQVPRHACRLVG